MRLRLILLLWLAACASRDDAAAAGATLPPEPERRRRAVPLRHVAESPADASFTAIEGLDVDSRGFIYVPDSYQQRVFVLGPDLAVVRTFGRRGSGPGEFRAIARVQALPGDSLLVYDPSQGRYTVFAADSARPAYTVNLGARLSGPSPYDVVRIPSNTGLVAYFRPQFAFLPGADFNSRRDQARLLEVDGTPRADLVTYPSRGFLVSETSVTPDPFGSEGFMRVDSRDRFYFVWSDSLAVEGYAPDGSRSGGFRVSYTAPAVTQADLSRAIAGLHPLDRPKFERVLRDSLPARWPAVRQVLVDDKDRLWMQLGGSASRETEWAAFTPEGRYLGSFLVSAAEPVLLIRAGLVYTTRLDENDVPRVVVHRMARGIP